LYAETLIASLPPGNNRINNLNGRVLKSYTDERGLRVLGLQYPTHMAKTGVSDILDITALKNIHISTTMKALYKPLSDHLEILLNLGDEKGLLRTYTRTFREWA
jgi:hypothetical protein